MQRALPQGSALCNELFYLRFLDKLCVGFQRLYRFKLARQRFAGHCLWRLHCSRSRWHLWQICIFRICGGRSNCRSLRLLIGKRIAEILQKCCHVVELFVVKHGYLLCPLACRTFTFGKCPPDAGDGLVLDIDLVGQVGPRLLEVGILQRKER